MILKSAGWIATIFAFTAIISACDTQTEQTTESGLTYTYITKGSGDEVKNGEFLVMNLELCNDKDSVLFSSLDSGFPQIFPVSDSLAPNNKVEEAFLLGKRVGDSLHIKLSALDAYGPQNIPQGVSPDEMLTVILGVTNVEDEAGIQALQQEFMARSQREAEEKAAAQTETDIAIIDKYLADNNITAQVANNGLRYIITEPGSGPLPEAGDQVKVHYVGKLLDGRVFDTSIESVAKEAGKYSEQREYEPLQFTVGQGMVIRGWDEGLMMFPKGSKGTIYIPSPLAYGPQARSAEITENSILMFDVEMVDITKE
ncbi:FKBP-type peptidyl-prolyl cis-trans isomerase [Peijinzhouia sedimentorum]